MRSRLNTGIGAKAFRATSVKATLKGKAADPPTIDRAASHAADGVDPLADIYASPEFRAELARVFTRRALTAAAKTDTKIMSVNDVL